MSTAEGTGPWYLLPNLLLGTLPLLFVYLLLKAVERHGWRDLRTGAWAVAWLGFLPNSFYILTDFIHLQRGIHQLDPYLGIITFGLFSFVGMAVGFVSLVMVHRILLRWLRPAWAYVAVEVVLWLSSMAIYLGRSLRWNTWDIVVHPVGMARDVLDGALVPTPEGTALIAMFFVLLSSLYAAIWSVWRPIPGTKPGA